MTGMRGLTVPLQNILTCHIIPPSQLTRPFHSLPKFRSQIPSPSLVCTQLFQILEATILPL